MHSITRHNALYNKFKASFRYRHLIKLISTCVVLFLIPCIIAMTVMLRHAYEEVKHSNESNYIEVTNLFAQCFAGKLSELQNEAYQIDAGSRDNSSAFYGMQIPLLDESPYYYYTFQKIFAQYNDPSVGLYYPDGDCLITRSGKFTAYSYANYYLKLRDQATRDQLIAFFVDSESVKTRFCPLYGEFGTNTLHIAIPVRLGLTKESVLLFFQLNAESINLKYFSPSGQPDAQFAVLSAADSKLLYSTGASYVATFGGSLPLSREAVQTLSVDGVLYYLFSATDEALGYHCVGILPFDALMTNIQPFYSVAQRILTSFCVCLVLLTALMIYINYNPIYRLVRKLTQPGGDSELNAITHTFQQINDEKSELNMLVVDLLLGNLLYGHPITESNLNNLGLARHSGGFGVLTLAPHKLNTHDRQTLTTELASRLDIISYITDIPGKDHTVMIYLISGTDNGALISRVRQWLTVRFPAPFDLRVGRVVEAIDEIHISYADCLDTPAASPADPSGAAEEKSDHGHIEQLKENVLAYLQTNFNDPNLSQSAVADYFDISIYTLSRLFKKRVGLGFSEYITGKRLDYAKELLLTTTLPIGKIAINVGIPNVNYFSRLFKQNFGVSPVKYREASGSTPGG